MIISELLNNLEPSTEITVVNEPFSYVGKITITLDGGDARYWLFSKSGKMLAVAPDDEEIFFLRHIDEELEAQGGIILYQGKEYELNYSDAGAVDNIDGSVDAMEEDRYAFADYEQDNGDIIRLVTNENTGEKEAYIGGLVVDEEILPVE